MCVIEPMLPIQISGAEHHMRQMCGWESMEQTYRGGGRGVVCTLLKQRRIKLLIPFFFPCELGVVWSLHYPFKWEWTYVFR